MEIWAIDANWNTISEFITFDEANNYWDNKPNNVIQILYRENYSKPVNVFKSI